MRAIKVLNPYHLLCVQFYPYKTPLKIDKSDKDINILIRVFITRY